MRKAMLALAVAALASQACGSDAKKPPTAPTGDTQQATTKPVKQEAKGADQEKPGDNPSQSQINISEEIRKACGISDSDAHFAFDSANVRDQDQKILQQLATCFTTGPLKGRQMRLVGHADPRGEPEYNMVLGGKRADNVKDFIVKQGMNDAKIQTTSRGEMDATGTDEASWARDRRVDVMLGE